MSAREFVELSGTAAELAGVGVIAGGLVLATARSALSSQSIGRYQRWRQDLGRAILLGLELEGRWPWQRPLEA